VALASRAKRNKNEPESSPILTKSIDWMNVPGHLPPIMPANRKLFSFFLWIGALRKENLVIDHKKPKR
jgi:hypothetical protein